MNAGGVPNTCKSNEAIRDEAFGLSLYRLSGERVSNVWRTYLGQGDNVEKSALIPHNLFDLHESKSKALAVLDGSASD